MQRCLPKVSVVVPAFNSERYIAEAVTSVLDQSCPDFELIIINDGSTDATEAVVASISDPRIRLVSQQNRGPSAARNAGIALSTGEYVAFLDADDIWHPNKLKRQLSYVVDTDARAVFSWVNAFADDDPTLEAADVTSWMNQRCPSQAGMMALFFEIGNFLCTSSALVAREALIAAGGFCLTAIQAQDFDLWIKLAKTGRIEVLPEKLVSYRKRKQNANLTYDPANAARIRFEYQQIYRTMFDNISPSLFAEAFPGRARKAKVLSDSNFELEKAFLYLEHAAPSIIHIGLEQLYNLLQNPSIVEIALDQYDFTLPDLFGLTRLAPMSDSDNALWRTNWQDLAQQREATIAELRAWVANRDEAVRWHDEQRQVWQDLAQQLTQEREIATTKHTNNDHRHGAHSPEKL